MADTLPTGATAPTLTVVDGIPTTTSIEVARHFGKRHDDVLRLIRNLVEQLPEGYARNFAAIQIDVDLGMGRTRQDPAYRLTRDGFTLLAMGFTGQRALKFKLAYIDAFNRLERRLLAQQAELPGINPRALMLAGQAPAVPLTKAQHAMVNRRAWQMAHEAYELAVQHLERRVAYSTSLGDRADPASPRLSEVIRKTTLGNALAHSFHHEVAMAVRTAQLTKRLADDCVANLQKMQADLQPPAQLEE